MIFISQRMNDCTVCSFDTLVQEANCNLPSKSQILVESIKCAATKFANVTLKLNRIETWLVPLMAPVDGYFMLKKRQTCAEATMPLNEFGVCALQFIATANLQDACYHNICDTELSEDGLQSLSAISLMTLHSIKTLASQYQ